MQGVIGAGYMERVWLEGRRGEGREMEQEERGGGGDGVEWEHLTLLPGHDALLTAAALGATPLLWIACRAAPCLLHIFCDSHLLAIWRFPADPRFLSIGPGASSDSGGQPAHSAASLMVITQDGCIWIMKLAETAVSTDRPSKKQKAANSGEIQRLKLSVTKNSSIRALSTSQSGRSQQLHHLQKLFRDGDAGVTNGPYADSGREGVGTTPINHGDPEGLSSHDQTQWKELTAESYTPAPRAVEVKNVVVAETLLGTVPGATVAAFGPNNFQVAIVASFGPPELLQTGKLSPSFKTNRQHPYLPASGPVFRREPTCLLFASSSQKGPKDGPIEGQAIVSHNLFISLCGQSTDEPHGATLLLQGDMDGKVYSFRVGEDGSVAHSPQVVCHLQQPIVAIFPVGRTSKDNGSDHRAPTSQASDNITGTNWLVVIGQLGRVAFLSSVRDQVKPEEVLKYPFLIPPLSRISSGRSQSLSNLEELVVSERKVKGPIVSACLLGPTLLCYMVASEVFVVELFENSVPAMESNGVGHGVKKLMRTMDPSTSSNAGMQLRPVLLSRRVSINNVAAIAGPGLSTYRGSRPLVALMRSGSLQSVKVSEQSTTPVTIDKSGYSGCDITPKGNLEEKVKVLLQSIADVQSLMEAIQSYDKALTLAMNELALALPRAYDITANVPKMLKTSIHNNNPISKSNSTPTDAGLRCTLTATPIPVIPLAKNRLSFGGPEYGNLRKQSSCVDQVGCNNYETRLDICLLNHSRNPLSQYWSLIVELQSCLSSIIPSAHLSFTINHSLGLPVGSHWNHSVNVRLPGGPWGPVMATIYLCHVHDYHKALLTRGSDSEQSRTDLKMISNASCVVLLRQRVDIISLLGSPPPRLGHTSWTPSFSGNTSLKKSLASAAAPQQAEALDLGDGHLWKSFCGSLAWSNRNGSTDATIARQNALLNSVLQQATVPKVENRWRLAAQGGDTVLISLDGRAGNARASSSVINIQTPSLLLGILVREALLWHLVVSEDKADGGDGKGETVGGGETVDIIERFDQVEALAQRARSVMHLWKKFQRPNAPTSADLVVPLLGHTYAVTQELVQAYKSHREDSSSSL